jgi:hypothetical protein
MRFAVSLAGLVLLFASWEGEGQAGKPGKPGPQGPAGKPAAAAAPSALAVVPIPLGPVAAGTPDGAFCGVEPAEPAAAPALPCKLPGLPCGPVPAGRIGQGGADPADDLDGDGQPDITLAGRRGDAAYGVVYLYRYRSGPAGYVLSDFHVVDGRSDPQVAVLALEVPGQAPIVRDGYDLPETGGHSLSVARLRRWDGERFRTLLSFCAHRVAPLAEGGQREGHNRVEFVDVDKDGAQEVVLSGLLRPLVFRFAEGGLALREDPALTERYREQSPQERQARALRAEAARLYGQGEWRRAAAQWGRANDLSPHHVPTKLLLAGALLRLQQAPQAVAVLRQALALTQGAEQAPVHCLLADAYRKQDDEDEERKALQACLSSSAAGGALPQAQRAAAEARLKELEAEEVDAGAAARDMGGSGGATEGRSSP